MSMRQIQLQDEKELVMPSTISPIHIHPLLQQSFTVSPPCVEHWGRACAEYEDKNDMAHSYAQRTRSSYY